tara:strand:+ start:8269 stop:8445 length:177 start_codon:yes stop_codon:yes gene_type:complete
MESKKCRDCGKMINPKSKIAAISNGYLLSSCKPCKRIEARKYQEKKRKLKEGTFWEVK